MDFDYGLFRLPDLGYWLTVSVTGQQWMLTLPTHLISPLVYPRVRVCLALIFFLLLILHYEIYYGSLSLPFHIYLVFSNVVF